MRIPLSLRIFLLLMFNVILAVLLLSWIAGKYYSVGWNQLTRSGAEPRLVSMAELVNESLDEADREDWGKVLEGFEKAYQVDLGLYRPFEASFIEGTQWEEAMARLPVDVRLVSLEVPLMTEDPPADVRLMDLLWVVDQMVRKG